MTPTIHSPVQSRSTPDPTQGFVLIVDDNPTNLAVLSEAVKSVGWRYRVAIDGESALNSIACSPPDIILLDIQMPGIDGFEVCRRLKADPVTQSIPVIFMTALNDLKSKAKGFELGAVDYIPKPFDQAEILARIRVHLQLKQLTDSLEAQVHDRTLALQQTLQDCQTTRTALSESETRLRALTEHFPGVLYQFKIEASGAVSFPYVSSGSSWLWEIEAERVQADAALVMNLVHPEDHRSFHVAVAKSAQTLEPWEWTGRLITPSGQQKWIQGRSGPERLANGDTIWHGFVVDITERKRLEADRQKAITTLQQQEQLLRSIYEGVEHSIVVIDVTEEGQFQYVQWNHATEKVTGLVNAEIVGKTPIEAFGEIQGTLLQQNYQRCLTAGDTLTYEEFVPFQGRDIWWLTTLNPLRDDRDRIHRIVLSTFDITDRKVTEVVLSQKAQREQLIHRLTTQIRSSLDFNAIVTTALDEIRNFLQIDACTLTWCYLTEEPRFECIYESHSSETPSYLGCYTLSELGVLGEKAINLEMVQMDATTTDSSINQFLHSFGIAAFLMIPVQNQADRVQIIACHHRQARQWTENEIEVIQAVMAQLAIALNQANLYEQSQTRAAELATTLAELQRTQAQLVQSEKMSSLGQLVAGIAHEINNPVSFIHGNVTHIETYTRNLLELIELYQQVETQPSPRIAEKIEEVDLSFIRSDLPKLLNSMRTGTERIREIVRSLRSFSRLDEAEFKEVDIHAGIESTLLILQHRLQSETTEIKVIKQYGDLPLVECFAGQLNQVLMNLISNAIDTLELQDRTRTPEAIQQDPSQITISTELNPLHQVIIRIADNGLGIPDTLRQRVFDPFYTTKSVGKGTGMGLSISYQIITEKHNGQLYCQSTPSQGSEFIIEIPVRQS